MCMFATSPPGEPRVRILRDFSKMPAHRPLFCLSVAVRKRQCMSMPVPCHVGRSWVYHQHQHLPPHPRCASAHLFIKVLATIRVHIRESFSSWPIPYQTILHRLPLEPDVVHPSRACQSPRLLPSSSLIPLQRGCLVFPSCPSFPNVELSCSSNRDDC